MPWYKKLFFILTTIPIVVWITIKFVFFKASAAMVAPSVLSGLALILAGLLVSAGVTVNTENGSYSGSSIYDLPPATIEQAFLEFATSDAGQTAIKNGLIDSSSAAVDLSAWINDNIKMSSGGGSGDNNDPSIGPVGNALTTAGALALVKTVIDWIKDNQDSVKTETAEGDYPAIDGAVSALAYYNEGKLQFIYYSSEPGQITYRSNGFKYFIQNIFYALVYNPNTDSYDTKSVSSSGSQYYYDSPKDLRFLGTWLDTATAEPFPSASELPTGAQPMPIGSLDVEGVNYPINPDGSVTIDGINYYPSNNGTYSIPSVTNEGDTIYNSYSPTYNISNYDDSAVIDLLTELTKQVQGLYTQPNEPVIENIEVSLNNALAAVSPVIELIPFNGWQSVMAVVESAVFVESPPQDIILKFNTSFSNNEVGGEFVLIPASIIEDWKPVLTTIKILVSIILLYFWLRFALRTLTSLF